MLIGQTNDCGQREADIVPLRLSEGTSSGSGMGEWPLRHDGRLLVARLTRHATAGLVLCFPFRAQLPMTGRKVKETLMEAAAEQFQRDSRRHFAPPYLRSESRK